MCRADAVLSVILCHSGKPCMLKTGMREGPTHLKSFFICSVLNEPCAFSQKARFVFCSFSFVVKMVKYFVLNK